MNLESLINQIFQEKEFYELLLFDIEESYEAYSSKYIHLYFERTKDNKVKITEIVYFKDSKEMNQIERKIIEKKEWFEISQNEQHYNLLLCRFDRTGYISSIFKDSTRTQDSKLSWADEDPDWERRMTRDEIRQAVQELSGFFQNQQELQKLKSKKAV